MSKKSNVVIGLLGTTLDAGHGFKRWRPSISLCQHHDFPITRFELLYGPSFLSLAEHVAKDMRLASPNTVVQLVPIAYEDAWDFEQVYGSLHDFALEYSFDVEHENYFIHISTGSHVSQICLFLLTESHDLPGLLIQTSPSRNGQKSEGLYRIIDLDLSKYDRIASRFEKKQAQRLSVLKSGIDTRNVAFNRLIEELEKVAMASRAPILLTGPTGSGKTWLARRVFELKKQCHQLAGDFVEVNCATLRGDAAMSTLFGHVKGAFTGAASSRDGLLRKADKGLLFLDEIGELGLDEQAMLLRAVEDKSFFSVGSDRLVSSNFQLIVGTNRNLSIEVMQGRFREDLLARIHLWPFQLPALTERLEDLEPNLDFELAQSSSTLGIHVTFNREAREHFLAFATSREALWLGNFRDFSAAIMRMATLAQGGRIDLQSVHVEINRLQKIWSARQKKRDLHLYSEMLSLQLLGEEMVSQLDRFDRVQLEDVLHVCAQSPSLSAAGRILFSYSRQSKTQNNDADRLRKYLVKFGLTWANIQQGLSTK